MCQLAYLGSQGTVVTEQALSLNRSEALWRPRYIKTCTGGASDRSNHAKTHKKVYRPWGNYLSVDNASLWKIKKIEVNPGASLSLQLHKKRAEHWIVVEGSAKIEIDNKELDLIANQSCYVPVGTKHRLSNPGEIPLIIIEVQSGKYLGEDDIIRFKDIYGREVL